MNNSLSHNAEHGGLMNKSIGEHYPWSVMGVGTDQGEIRWVVVDYLTNWRSAMEWDSCEEAHSYMEEFL